MPSGKTHDLVTVLLSVPALGIGVLATGDVWLAALVSGGFLFGGLMFGPDLDTASKQYARWRFMKILWFPYRTFFKHRSRWSHGLIFGTLLRVIYLMGILTGVAFVLTYAYSAYAGKEVPAIWEFTRIWSTLRGYSDAALGAYGALALFFGMWIGAASHTITDLAGTYVRTGRARL